jgi:hypothetical protein
MFEALANAGINIQMITTSEIKISVLVDRDAAVEALRAVHKVFELERPAGDLPGRVGEHHLRFLSLRQHGCKVVDVGTRQ